MHLYEIDERLSRLMDHRELELFESAGEITPQVEAIEREIDEYLSASVDKIEAALVVIQQLEIDADILKAEEKRLADRRKRLEGNSERLRGIVAAVLDRVFDSKIKTPRFTASVAVSNSSSV